MTREQRLRAWLLGAVLFLALVYLLRDMLTPFVAGMVIAYFLDPIADKLERAGLSRLLATSLITVAFFVLFLGGLALLAPVVQHQIVDFAASVPGYVKSLSGLIEPAIKRIQSELSPADFEKLRDSATGYAGTVIAWAGQLLGRLWAGGLALAHFLGFLFITPVVVFYLLYDWDRLVAKVDGWLPRAHAPVIRDQVKEIDRTLAGFVRGQATVCLILAAFYGIGLSLLDLDIGLVVGVATGLLAFIPYVGALSGFLTAMGLALVQFSDALPIALVAGIFAAGQVLEGNFLTPKLVGGRIGLHPVWIIFALMAGGSLVGFVGVLLAVPVAAVVGVLIRFALKQYLASPLYLHEKAADPSPANEDRADK